LKRTTGARLKGKSPFLEDAREQMEVLEQGIRMPKAGFSIAMDI
jgi:hypothetical protein